MKPLQFEAHLKNKLGLGKDEADADFTGFILSELEAYLWQENNILGGTGGGSIGSAELLTLAQAFLDFNACNYTQGQEGIRMYMEMIRFQL